MRKDFPVTPAHADSIYRQVAAITERHLGDEANEYIAKLIRVHLQKPADEITRLELIGLIDWIRVAAAFFVVEIEKLDRYIDELKAIGHSKGQDTSKYPV